jgi:NhaP-type Na+/H+ or K+/H+ antiporter
VGTQAAGEALSTDQTLLGLGLVIVLALACLLVSGWLRLPAIVLLLPVGFAAGAATASVHPDVLLGNAYQPLVSLGVGVILFEAGLRLRFDELSGGIRPVVLWLVIVGPLVTGVGVTIAATQVFGLEWGVAAVLGAIFVVSGPTVVLPLLAFVRPPDRLRSILKWEGVLIDPIGALLGVLVFHVVNSSPPGAIRWHPGEFALSTAVGLAVGGIGAAVLWLLLRRLQRSAPALGAAATLMVVVGALVAADMIREDSGFLAATVMGMALANQTRLDLARIVEFQGVVVGLTAASDPSCRRNCVAPRGVPSRGEQSRCCPPLWKAPAPAEPVENAERAFLAEVGLGSVTSGYRCSDTIPAYRYCCCT